MILYSEHLYQDKVASAHSGVALCTPKEHVCFPYYVVNVDSQVCKYSWLQKIWILLVNFRYKYSYKSFVKVRCTELKNMSWRKPKYLVM